MAAVPTVDFSKFFRDEVAAREEVGKEIVSAFKTIGFVTLVNHGVPESVTERAFEESKKFFVLDKSIKELYKYQSAASNRGYICMGGEKLDASLPDLKESFDIGDEADATYSNRWPEEHLPDFKPVMLEYFAQYDALHLNVMRCIAIGLGYDAEFFTSTNNGNHQNLRLLHYPQVDRERISGSQKRGGKHTDYGTITLLSQQDVSGLQAQCLDGTWISVPPVKGGIVVNVGEMLQRMSNDLFRATPHQVLDDETDSPTVPMRYSIAFFCNANKDSTLDCLPDCSAKPDNPYKYTPINAHDYITRRLTETVVV